MRAAFKFAWSELRQAIAEKMLSVALSVVDAKHPDALPLIAHVNSYFVTIAERLKEQTEDEFEGEMRG